METLTMVYAAIPQDEEEELTEIKAKMCLCLIKHMPWRCMGN
jgi:hypothetical protein